MVCNNQRNSKSAGFLFLGVFVFQPYTYYLFHIPTGKKYYGVQYERNANPLNLWVTYFSSSSRVNALIEEYGKQSFLVEVRKLFNSGEEARKWEDNVLRRLKVVERDDWLNQSYASGPFYCATAMLGKHHSEETKRKMSQTHMGNTNAKGTKRTKETKRKMSQARMGNTYVKGTKQTEESNKKRSNTLKGRSTFWLKGKYQSVEHKEKRSKSMKEWWRKRKESQLLAEQNT